MKLLVIHGPNLQLLGVREPDIYGKTTLKSINEHLREVARECDVELDVFQSNIEGEIVDRIAVAFADGVDGIVINPAAYTHTSIAILDALKAVKIPAVEVQLSNITGRESFRHTSMTAAGCVGIFAGFGADTYEWALRALIRKLSPSSAGK